jgi:hypothetical protein
MSSSQNSTTSPLGLGLQGLGCTPGAWSSSATQVINSSGKLVVDTNSGHDSMSYEEAKANALLIAAIPEMFLALKAVVGVHKMQINPDTDPIQVMDMYDLSIAQAIAAISKAGGEVL